VDRRIPNSAPTQPEQRGFQGLKKRSAEKVLLRWFLGFPTT
jgi:hypothetical protein